MKDLIVIQEKPVIPADWDYEVSVGKVKHILYKWINITEELANELWVAREKLRDIRNPNKFSGTIVPLKTWTQYCIDIGSSKQAVNRWLKRIFEVMPQLQTALPRIESKVIYADPPWNYANKGFDQSAAQQYPTMETESICEMKVKDIAGEKAVLFLWVTYPFAREGFAVCDAWGFSYKSQMVWKKNTTTGMGFYVKPRHELLYIATKGSALPAVLYDSVFEFKTGKHSEKPDELYHMIEAMYTGPYIELFARNKPQELRRKGWSYWGNEVESKES